MSAPKSGGRIFVLGKSFLWHRIYLYKKIFDIPDKSLFYLLISWCFTIIHKNYLRDLDARPLKKNRDLTKRMYSFLARAYGELSLQEFTDLDC